MSDSDRKRKLNRYRQSLIDLCQRRVLDDQAAGALSEDEAAEILCQLAKDWTAISFSELL